MKQPILDICKTVAQKMTHFDDLIAVSQKKENFIPYIQAYPWDPVTLSHGYPALICLFSELDNVFPDDLWKSAKHESIRRLVQAIETNGISNLSMFSGAAGICFSLFLASDGKNYYHLLSQMNDHLIEKIKTDYIIPFQKRPESIPPLFYDHITGITGVLAYLLHFIDQDEVKSIVLELIRIVVFITKPVIIQSQVVPGWYISSDHLLREEHISLYRHGCFDTGLAHGITGCLAILAKAMICGIQIQGQDEAMRRIIEWLLKTRCRVGKLDHIWPGRFGFHPSSPANVEILSDFYRDGWCYGVPGMSMAMLLSGCALKDQMIYQKAIRMMQSVCERYPLHSGLQCPSFCHGLAGLLSIVHQFHIATRDQLFSQVSAQIVDSIIRCYDERLPFGFKCLASLPGDGEVAIDNPGLLDGSSGILLSLLFYHYKSPRPWLPIFLLH